MRRGVDYRSKWRGGREPYQRKSRRLTQRCEAIAPQNKTLEKSLTPRTVDVHIRRIRSKVGPLIAAHITTVRGVGYLFKE